MNLFLSDLIHLTFSRIDLFPWLETFFFKNQNQSFQIDKAVLECIF